MVTTNSFYFLKEWNIQKKKIGSLDLKLVNQLLHIIPHSQASVLKRKRSDTKQIFKNSALKIEKKVKTGSLAFSLHVLVT